MQPMPISHCASPSRTTSRGCPLPPAPTRTRLPPACGPIRGLSVPASAAGAAFSGATLLRDVAALRSLGERCGRPDLFAAIIGANERHAGVALAWLEDSLGSLDGRHLAVAGLTYKPGTSTLRDSLPLRVVSQLLEHGATVNVWDPAAEAFEPPAGVTRASSLEECVQGADALVVMTALPELADVDGLLFVPPGGSSSTAAWGSIARPSKPRAGRTEVLQVASYPCAVDSSLPGQGLRFAIAGGGVALLYLAVTTILADVVGVPFQLALVVGFTTAVAAHFTLQRVFVWVHAEGFALPVHRQAGRYLVVAGLQYAATGLITATVPGPLGVRVTYVYLVTAVVLAALNFLVFRSNVFHPAQPLENRSGEA